MTKPFLACHAHIDKLFLVEALGHGEVIAGTDEAFTGKGEPPFQPFTAFTRDSVAPQLFNLLQAAPLMYQQLTNQHVNVERIKDYLRAGGIEEDHLIMNTLNAMQNDMMSCQLVAREGTMKIADQLARELSAGNKKP